MLFRYFFKIRNNNGLPLPQKTQGQPSLLLSTPQTVCSILKAESFASKNYFYRFIKAERQRV